MDTAIRPPRERLRRALAAAAVGVGVPALVCAAALGVDGWPAKRFVVLYTAPFLFAVLVWMRMRAGQASSSAAMWVDAAAVVLAALRMPGPLVPWSGHMLFYAYSGLAAPSRGYALLALALCAEATWFKLVLWRDSRSWALGLAAGFVLALIRAPLARAAAHQRNSSP